METTPTTGARWPRTSTDAPDRDAGVAVAVAHGQRRDARLAGGDPGAAIADGCARRAPSRCASGVPSGASRAAGPARRRPSAVGLTPYASSPGRTIDSPRPRPVSNPPVAARWLAGAAAASPGRACCDGIGQAPFLGARHGRVLGRREVGPDTRDASDRAPTGRPPPRRPRPAAHPSGSARSRSPGGPGVPRRAPRPPTRSTSPRAPRRPSGVDTASWNPWRAASSARSAGTGIQDEHGPVDVRGAQRHRLVQGRHADAIGARGQERPRGHLQAVAVAIRLDHRPDGRAGSDPAAGWRARLPASAPTSISSHIGPGEGRQARGTQPLVDGQRGAKPMRRSPPTAGAAAPGAPADLRQQVGGHQAGVAQALPDVLSRGAMQVHPEARRLPGGHPLGEQRADDARQHVPGATGAQGGIGEGAAGDPAVGRGHDGAGTLEHDHDTPADGRGARPLDPLVRVRARRARRRGVRTPRGGASARTAGHAAPTTPRSRPARPARWRR